MSSGPLILKQSAPPAAAARNLSPHFDLVDTRAGFEALKAEWDGLFEACGQPAQLFQRHNLLSAWADAYLGRQEQLAILVGRADGGVVTIWPLVRRRRLGLVELSVMGEPVIQFSDVVCRAEHRAAIMAAGWAHLRGLRADVLHARKVRADAALAAGLPGLAPYHHHAEAPYADLALRVDADGPGKAYSAKERSDFRRRIRRLAEQGAISIEAYGPGARAEALAEQALAWKRAWLESQNLVSATLGRARFDAFFKACAGDTDSALRVVALIRSGTPVGIDLSFDCKGSGFGHVIAVDPACEREGVGNVLIHHVFAAAKARGDARFEMLAPADDFKLRHADGSVAVNDLTVPFTASGRLYADVVLRRAMPFAKRAMKRFPRALAQPMARLFG